MKIMLLLVSCLVCYYVFTYARWAWSKGYRRGGVGLMGMVIILIGITGLVIWN
jgi:hypothetical protein